MASIQDRNNGTYLLVIEGGYDSFGKRIRHTKTIKASGIREARKRLSEFETEVEAGEYMVPEKMKFQTFVEEEWSKKYASKELAPLTYRNYLGHLNQHILPHIGHIRIDQIKTFHIVSLLDQLSKPGARKDGKGDILASGTIEYIFRVIKNVFNKCIEWRLLKNHPMAGLKKPKVTQAELEYYDEDEAQIVINALYKEPVLWRMFCLAAILGGFRRGELLGLEWTHVNFTRNTVSVNKSISLTIEGKAVVKGPKSKASRRSVPMPEWFMQELKDYHDQWEINRENAGELWSGDSYLFHTGFGKPLYHTTPSKWWKRFCKRHKLKYIRFHDLRHSTATILLQNDVSMKAIQERLGHSKHQVTADLYSHVAQSVSRAAANKFEKLDPRKNQSKLPFSEE